MSINTNKRKKPIINKYINLAVKDKFISATQADILKYNIERYGVIMIIKKSPTKEKKILKLISKSIPDDIDQIQIEALEKKDKGKLIRVFTLERYDISNETPNIFLRISGINPKYMIINKSLDKSSVADFVYHVLLKNGKDMFFNCSNYKHTVTIFELEAESKEKAFEKLNELYLHYLSNTLNNEAPDKNYIEKIKNSITCIISVDVENGKEISVENIEYKNTNNMIDIDEPESNDTEDFDNYMLQMFRDENHTNEKKSDEEIKTNN